MSDPKHYRRQLLLGGALLAFATTPAFAQDVVQHDAAAEPGAPAEAGDLAQAADATPPAPAPAAEGQLAEIVVTALRRETNLQQTPLSISVLSPQAMADRHVQSLGDLADSAIPSLRVATFEARNSALTVGIRGIVPFDQNQTARDTGVGVYIDGIYLGRSQGLNAALFDVERIEVLKGPAGHPVRPQHRRRRGQRCHPPADRPVRPARRGRLRQLQFL